MSFCINPKCFKRYNDDNLNVCAGCGSNLCVRGYHLISPIQKGASHATELFEVRSIDSGERKILKVLVSQARTDVELFKREIKVLRSLINCDAVPRFEQCFIVDLPGKFRPLPCFLMEKVEGTDLLQYLEAHGRVEPALVLDWLHQLSEILIYLHRRFLFHRDLKPSNIMLRPTGQVVLIDFGAVREITRTYEAKRVLGDITRVFSLGYTAPEQNRGRAEIASDLFALGRTMVHLLTEKHPRDLEIDPNTERLLWRDFAPGVSLAMAELIDDLMVSSVEDRIRDATGLKIRLEAIGSSATLVPKLPKFERQIWQGVALTLMVPLVLMGLRAGGWCQKWELLAFDWVVSARPWLEAPDSRLLVIEITEVDIKAQNPDQRRGGSLSDGALLKLLTKLEQFSPRAIGLDIYRDFPVSPAAPELKTRLSSTNSLIAVCKQADLNSDSTGVEPPPEVPVERLGFADFIIDPDGLVRRSLIAMAPFDPKASCHTAYAFSFQLALTYLAADGIEAKFTPAGELQLGGVNFPHQGGATGVYSQVDSGGYQLLLNYRYPGALSNLADHLSLAQVNAGVLTSELVKDRVVLIGVTGGSVGDVWLTPYGADKQVAGVWMQAQMVSQIISAVKDRRPLVTVLPFWMDGLIVGVGAVCGTIIGSRLNRWSYLLAVSALVYVGVIVLFAAVLWQLGFWLPLVPTLCALVSTNVLTVEWRRRTAQID